jgi:hypothetical protein
MCQIAVDDALIKEARAVTAMEDKELVSNTTVWVDYSKGVQSEGGA